MEFVKTKEFRYGSYKIPRTWTWQRRTRSSQGEEVPQGEVTPQAEEAPQGEEATSPVQRSSEQLCLEPCWSSSLSSAQYWRCEGIEE